MPGPMPSATPDTLKDGSQGDSNTENSGAGVIIGVIAGVLLLLAAAAASLLILRNRNKAASKKRARKQTANPANGEYHAKQHRKTEEHMKFERRERYTRTVQGKIEIQT